MSKQKKGKKIENVQQCPMELCYYDIVDSVIGNF
nr:MAG TPA: hypothetical protein [Caudoviricetes sp.]